MILPKDDGFVNGEPVLHFVSVAAKNNPCILHEIGDNLLAQPATFKSITLRTRD